MHRFKLYICERDLIEIAHGNMDKVNWYPRKPKQCSDAYCNFESILEVHLTIVNPIKDGKNKGSRKNVVSSSTKRKTSRKKIR